MIRIPRQTLFALVALTLGDGVSGAAADFEKHIRPTFKEYCLGCHSAEKHKGDLDLERFDTSEAAKQNPKVWQAVIEQLSLGEMPPKDKPQPTPARREQLLGWANGLLDDFARAHAGDPGHVVLRRLSNAEYTYTVRDLTGVGSLEPAKEFPTDSAAGEGFMNVGNSLVMSPSLVTKYLDAGKEIANHAVLLPDGIAFSPSTSPRDWSEEKLAAIRAFYAQFTDNGGGSAVNLQGIKFDTKDGGVLPLRKYLAATISLRAELKPGKVSVAEVARSRGLNAKYLGTLWAALNDPKPSPVLDGIRAQWRSAKPADADALTESIAQWQRALWRFTQVGHIGKRDGPKAWQVPVTPLAHALEVRMKLPAPAAGTGAVTLYLAASDAGDGNTNDFAVWESPRLVAPGRPDLALRDVRAAVGALTAHREKIIGQAAECLAAAAEFNGLSNAVAVAQLAQKYAVEPAALAAWLECLGLGAGEARIDSELTRKLENAQNYDFIKGWIGADELSVLANSSDQHVRVPGNMKPHGVAVHPSPSRDVVVGWRSPIATTVSVSGSVQHAHTECGNGVTWTVELRRGQARQRLAAGTAQDATVVSFGPFENLAVQPGDVVSVVIGSRDGNHSCDLTAVDLNLSDGTHIWNLAKDVSSNILAGNPHADGQGNAGVWHFYSEPDQGGGSESVLPGGSLLAKWQTSPNAVEKRQLAAEVQKLLVSGGTGLGKDAPDAALYRQLTLWNGPLLESLLHGPGIGESSAPVANDSGVAAANWGPDPAQFGKHPNGTKIGPTNLCVRAPSVIEVRLPAELAAGREFVVTGTLHQETGAEGSVQFQVLTNPPSARLGPTASPTIEPGGKRTWTDGERPAVSEVPIIVADGSAVRRRFEAAFHEVRQLFPAAVCYTKIVPVDEAITLTLYYREDDHLRRLMLDDMQVTEIDRLWTELHYVSQDPLKLVDAFEQIWQFATQDADPSVFTPMRDLIKQHAEEYRTLLVTTQPAHLAAVLRIAEGAYRRPLTDTEKNELRELYQKLRTEELPHDQAVRLTLARVLVAPAFLYRAEQPGPGVKAAPVNDWELATRLSYFLWSSAPDAELRAVAAGGKLHQPAVLAAQTRRMLRDARARRLATEFACAWLHVYDFDELGEKSERHFPTFTGLRGAMYEETIRFFTDLFQRDGSVLNIIDADYTFLNAELAKHYGIPDSVFRSSRRGEAPTETRNSKPETRNNQSLVTSAATNQDNGWRRVDGVKRFARGGILAQATTLAKQSGASRTSPILRGNWLCETLLGEKLPRPPKDVPRLPEDEATETLTVRQLTEKHTADPKCYGCHRRIDAYGYSLEAFDAIGRHRERDLGGRPIDTHAKVLDGSEFDGLDGLRHYLLTTRRDAFLKQFCRKLLGYSLGRSVLLSDGPLIAEMQSQLKKHDYRISATIETIVRSPQFREIRGIEVAFED